MVIRRRRRRRRSIGVRVVLCGLGRKLREELAAMELLFRMDPQQALGKNAKCTF
jgi:hypothetical protein